MATVTHKVCTMCGLDKTASEYYADKRAPHGLCTQCKQCMNERKKAKRAIDPEATRAAWREDYRLHKDRYARAAETYYVRHYERAKEWRRHNSNKRRVDGEVELSAADFAEWVLAQEKRCTWCGLHCPDKFQVDHIVPLAKGGAHELANLAICCSRCNRRKSNKMPHEFLAEVGSDGAY